MDELGAAIDVVAHPVRRSRHWREAVLLLALSGGSIVWYVAGVTGRLASIPSALWSVAWAGTFGLGCAASIAILISWYDDKSVVHISALGIRFNKRERVMPWEEMALIRVSPLGLMVEDKEGDYRGGFERSRFDSAESLVVTITSQARQRGIRVKGLPGTDVPTMGEDGWLTVP